MFAPWKSRRAPRASQPGAAEAPQTIPSVHSVDSFWCDKHGLFLRGWLHCHGKTIESLAVCVGEDRALVTWHERTDVLKHYPAADSMCGFEVYLSCRPYVPLFFEIETADGIARIPVELPASPARPKHPPTSLYTDFIHKVNDDHLSILEIGCRPVGERSIDNRQYYPGASRYVGMDIHPGPGVDIVGDVHQLSSLVEPESFDAIYSLAVLEHIQVPWIAAIEMNRVLKTGGTIFHSTVHSWPLHEMPNDFWRFSDEGLKVLFGPMFGFEVIGANMGCPVVIVPEIREPGLNEMPLTQSYAEASIAARKVGPATEAGWNLLERAKQYPKRA